MFLEDGVYIHKNTDYVLISSGIGMYYNLNWHGDLAAWELTRHDDSWFDVWGANFDDEAEMMARVIGLQWTPSKDDIYFIPFSELPFSGHPKVSSDGRSSNISKDPSENPVLAWIYDAGIVNE